MERKREIPELFGPNHHYNEQEPFRHLIPRRRMWGEAGEGEGGRGEGGSETFRRERGEGEKKKKRPFEQFAKHHPK